jgi:hypothetical protein
MQKLFLQRTAKQSVTVFPMISLPKSVTCLFIRLLRVLTFSKQIIVPSHFLIYLSGGCLAHINVRTNKVSDDNQLLAFCEAAQSSDADGLFAVCAELIVSDAILCDLDQFVKRILHLQIVCIVQHTFKDAFLHSLSVFQEYFYHAVADFIVHDVKADHEEVFIYSHWNEV